MKASHVALACLLAFPAACNKRLPVYCFYGAEQIETRIGGWRNRGSSSSWPLVWKRLVRIEGVYIGFLGLHTTYY